MIHLSSSSFSVVVCMYECLLLLHSLRRAVKEHEQQIAVLEGCRSSVDQEALTLRSSVRELEKSRLHARRELQELRRQVRNHGPVRSSYRES